MNCEGIWKCQLRVLKLQNVNSFNKLIRYYRIDVMVSSFSCFTYKPATKLKSSWKKKYNTLYVLRNQETKPYIDCLGFTRLNGKININQNNEYWYTECFSSNIGNYLCYHRRHRTLPLYMTSWIREAKIIDSLDLFTLIVTLSFRTP